MSEDNLPMEIGRGKLKLAPGLEIEVINLDNGQRLIAPEGFEDFLNWLSSGGDPNLVIDAKLMTQLTLRLEQTPKQPSVRLKGHALKCRWVERRNAAGHSLVDWRRVCECGEICPLGTGALLAREWHNWHKRKIQVERLNID
jgi:hypothetical protein